LMRHLSAAEQAAFGVIDGKAVVAEVKSPVMSAPLRFKTIPQGAATQVWAATNEKLEGKGGVYCEDCDIAELAMEAESKGVRPYAIDSELADRLWARSEAWTGAKLETRV
jgi:hypothetical protein